MAEIERLVRNSLSGLAGGLGFRSGDLLGGAVAGGEDWGGGLLLDEDEGGLENTNIYFRNWKLLPYYADMHIGKALTISQWTMFPLPSAAAGWLWQSHLLRWRSIRFAKKKIFRKTSVFPASSKLDRTLAVWRELAGPRRCRWRCCRSWCCTGRTVGKKWKMSHNSFFLEKDVNKIYNFLPQLSTQFSCYTRVSKTVIVLNPV